MFCRIYQHSELILWHKYSFFNMKLIIVLSIIACGYADKLDRTYLPPLNAATAGGSPGSLIAPEAFASGRPGSNSGQGSAFVQGFASGRQPGSGQFSPTYGQVAGSPQKVIGFGTNQGSGGINQVPSGINQFQVGTGSNAAAPGDNGKSSLLRANAPFGTGKFGIGAQQTYSPQSGASSSQVFGQGSQDINLSQAQAYKPERPQAAADQNAEILKYINENDGESYQYSYETSNGISAEETGVATDGVRAQGGFSYTGDDGQAYSLTYTADENGFQPQGEHLPTPYPIPEEILKSIEENARAAAAGTQEGAYRPEEDESEIQQYNEVNSYNRPQGQNQESIKEPFSQRPANQFSVNKGAYGPSSQSGQISEPRPSQTFNKFTSVSSGPQGQISQYQPGSESNQGPASQFSQSSQIGQSRPNQGSSQFSAGITGPQLLRGQYQTGFGNSQGPFRQSSSQGSSEQGLGQTSQGQSSSGYNYNQPQNAFGSNTPFGSGGRPQSNQGQITSTLGSQNNQGLQSSNISPSKPSFGAQYGSGQSQNFNRPTEAVGNFGQGKIQLNENKPLKSSQDESGRQGSGRPSISDFSGYQYEANANRPSFGSRPNGIGSQSSQGTRYQTNTNQPSISANNGIKGSNQFSAGNTGFGKTDSSQPTGNRPISGNRGTNQGSSPFGGSSGIQKSGPGNMFGQVNQPSFGSKIRPSQENSQFGPVTQQLASSQGPSGPLASVQAPYQYNRPSQSFPSPQKSGSSGFSSPSTGLVGVNGQRPGANSFGSPNANIRPGGSFSGSQDNIGQNSGYPGSQGATGRPGSTSGSQESIGQSPDYTGSQDVNRRPALTGTQGYNGQRPDSTASGSNQDNQRRPEQFGGPRQPPSFSPQEGYKY